MANPPDRQVPEGAAVFPAIPEELGVHPLLLATLHALVFLDGSDGDVIDAAAAEEAVEYLATYLQRLTGPDLRRIREDIEVLLAYARQEKWPQAEQQFLREFLADYGIGGENEA
jgi:hypothetical protein